MKVSILTCSVSRTAGGLLDAVRDLYKSMEAHKGTKLVTIYSYIDEYTKDDLPSWKPLLLKLYKKGNPFFYSSKVKADLLSSDTDILHVHGLWRYPHAFINPWKKKTKKAVLATPHGMLDPYIIANQGSVKRLIGNFLFADRAFKNIDCYQALNIAEMEVIRQYGIQKPIAVIPNGINLPTDSLDFEKIDDKKHLLFLGRLHPKKGVDMLINAIGEMRKDSPEILENWIVDIVGWPQENFDEVLRTLVEKHQIEDMVRFHGGLFGEAKQNIYATATAYILPSHSEGLPMTVLEAWAWNLPVIMTPYCNIPEGFEYNAALEVENTTSSVKGGLIKLFSMSDEDRVQMGSNGRRLVETQFTWDISARKMELLYEWVLNGGERPSFVYEIDETDGSL